MSVGFRLLGACCLAGLTGCDHAQNLAQLQTSLQAVPAGPVAIMAAVPRVEPPAVVAYAAAGLRSPFQAQLDDVATQALGTNSTTASRENVMPFLVS